MAEVDADPGCAIGNPIRRGETSFLSFFPLPLRPSAANRPPLIAFPSDLTLCDEADDFMAEVAASWSCG
jgi:hypothetical protein